MAAPAHAFSRRRTSATASATASAIGVYAIPSSTSDLAQSNKSDPYLRPRRSHPQHPQPHLDAGGERAHDAATPSATALRRTGRPPPWCDGRLAPRPPPTARDRRSPHHAVRMMSSGSTGSSRACHASAGAAAAGAAARARRETSDVASDANFVSAQPSANLRVAIWHDKTKSHDELLSYRLK